MRMLDLFSGIGGISLAADWAGIETVAFCEIEPFPQKVLHKHWPHVPIYDDVRQLTKERLEQDGIGTIDIISAGYPCQPFSVAGKREGENDDRHLWPEVCRLLKEIRPRWFIGENVAGHVTLGLDDVLSDLGDIGYTFQPFVVPSCAVNAPHRRDRVFILGYTEHDGLYAAKIGRGAHTSSDNDKEGQNEASQSSGTSRSDSYEDVAYTTGERFQGEQRQESERTRNRSSDSNKAMADTSSSGRKELHIATVTDRSGHSAWSNNAGGADRATQSRMGGVLDGISDRLDGHRWPAGQGQPQYDWEPPRVATGVKNRVGRLKSLGNAVNPWQIYPILYGIKAVDELIEGH